MRHPDFNDAWIALYRIHYRLAHIFAWIVEGLGLVESCPGCGDYHCTECAELDGLTR